MLLFLKDHVSFILVYFFNLFLLLLIGYLDIALQGHSISLPTLLYMSIVSTVILIIFLSLRYLRSRKNYKTLLTEWANIEQALQPFEETNEFYHFLNGKFKELYELHVEMLRRNVSARLNYSAYIHQWVHQMKTPISVMKLLIQNEETSAASDSFIKGIHEEVDKLHKGLEMVLFAARLEDFEKDLKIEKIQVNELVRKTINEHKTLFIKNKLYPEVKIEPSIIQTDHKWMLFALGQIVTNSIKYSSSRGQKIIFRSDVKEDSVHLMIQDNGIGIPKQDIKRIFEPFFTGVNGRKYQESTGMGLYLTKQICDKLGHTIKVESSVNQGTSISIVFHNMTKM